MLIMSPPRGLPAISHLFQVQFLSLEGRGGEGNKRVNLTINIFILLISEVTMWVYYIECGF